MSESDLFEFADEDAAQDTENATASIPTRTGTILIVDDEQSVHKITELVLKTCRFPGWTPVFLHAFSGQEALEVLGAHPETAVILLDVIMEHESAGFMVADHIRSVMHNKAIRIILRTGQAGNKQEHEVIESHDINDYKLKSELTSDRLYACVLAALRTFAQIHDLEESLEERSRTIDRISAKSHE